MRPLTLCVAAFLPTAVLGAQSSSAPGTASAAAPMVASAPAAGVVGASFPDRVIEFPRLKKWQEFRVLHVDIPTAGYRELQLELDLVPATGGAVPGDARYVAYVAKPREGFGSGELQRGLTREATLPDRVRARLTAPVGLPVTRVRVTAMEVPPGRYTLRARYRLVP